VTVSRALPRVAAPRRVGERVAVVTVPRTAFELVETDPAVRAAAGAVAVQVGSALEMPVDALDALVPGLGARAESFFLAARALWAVLDERPLPAEAVLVRVPLLDLRQKDSRTVRVDLSAQYEAIEHVAALRPVLGLLDADPDWASLAGLGVLERSGDRAELIVEVRSPLWPLELGGAPCPGELRRCVRLEASHAAWRDRRVRRLVRVRLDALQAWPDPAPFRVA